MKRTQKNTFSLLPISSIAAGFFSVALSFSVGCSENEGGDGKSSTSGKGEGSNTSSKESTTKDNSDKKKSAEPTEKKVQINLSNAPKDLENVRIAVHPELDFTGNGSKLGKVLADVAAKPGDNALLDLTIKPIDKDVDLGKAKVTILYVSMYKDNDKSESFTDGDHMIGTVRESLAYAREGNAKKLPEWTHADMASGKLVEITKPLAMVRVDNMEPTKSLAFSLKTEKVPEETGILGLVSPSEAQDFAKNFLDEPRGDLFKVDREKKEQALTLSAAPTKTRQNSKPTTYLPRFKNMSINLLAGFKSSNDEVTKESKIVGLGCVALEFNGKTLYDSMIALWVEPGADWVNDPASAYRALVDGYRPGWNPVAVQREDDGSTYAYRMGDQEKGRITISGDCKAMTQ